MYSIRASEKDYHDTESWSILEHDVDEFPWIYPVAETCLILEGSALISDEKANKLYISEGDMVFFEKGLHCHWKITKRLVKRYKLK